MALSVSGFPEPSRQLGSSGEVFTGDSGQDGSSKSTLMNSPRLRGLFGASSAPSKKPDLKHLSTTSKSEETEVLHGAITSATPPTATSALSFTSSFEPLSQQEYELELQLPMSKPFDPPRTHSNKRPQLPPLPRKTTASPVRLGPSLTRLDIGAFSRAPTTLHSHSKPPPPSVVVEEWGPKGSDGISSSSTQQSRPLPSVPGHVPDSSKHSVDNVAGPSVTVGPTTTPLGGASQHTNAIASLSKHVNAVAGSSKHPDAIPGSPKRISGPMSASKPSPSSTLPPPSKVIIRRPVPQRTHAAGSPSVSMRYQPLVATAESSPTSAASPVRPLPRIPPVPPVNTTYKSPAARIKRPKTSPGIISGFSVEGLSTTPSRSPFENISWPSRPSDAGAQRASSPPLPISSPMTSSRARSYSRSRRDRSLDSYYSISRTTPSGIVPPITTNVSVTNVPARPPRSLPSPTFAGARPLTKAMTFDQLASAAKLHIQTTNATMFMEKSGNNRILSPGGGKRSQPPLPPTGPMRPRPKATSISTPTVSAPPTISVIIPVQPQPVRPTKVSSAPGIITKMEAEIESEERQSLDAPMHSHPLEALTDTESLLHPPMSPAAAESPVSVFMDDKDLSTMSRSPSPMTYARPDSRGNLSDLSDEDINFASSSSTASSASNSPTRRRRTQLRSYRNSYRPHARTSPPHIPFRQSSPSPVQEQPQPPSAEPDKNKKVKTKRKTPRSYFGDYRASSAGVSLKSGSAPVTRASSPERKSRSRQPRKLTDAVSLALEEVRNRGRGTSPSPKSKLKASGPTGGTYAPPVSQPHFIDDMEVLDISRPSASRRDTEETTGTTDTATSSSVSDSVNGSTLPPRSSAKAKGGWGAAKSRSKVDESSKNASMSFLSSAGTTAYELDGAETPYMWVSTSKPPVPPASLMSASPSPMHHHHHRPMDSPGVEDYSHLNIKTNLDNEVDRYGMVTEAKPMRNQESTWSTVSASRPPSSSISSPFSGFSISNRSSTKSKSKHSPSASAPGMLIDEVLVIQHDPRKLERANRMNSDRSNEEASDADVRTGVTARRITRTVDDDGDILEREQETDVADVIPHLRHLKARKG